VPAEPREATPIALAYIGNVFPNEARFQTRATSRAGEMAQRNLLRGMREAGLKPSLLITPLPIPSFRASRTLLVGGTALSIPESDEAYSPGFINIAPLKQVMVGISTFLRLIAWSMKHRDADRVMYQFNLTFPPGLFMLLAARMTGSKAVGWINDINMPGETVPRTWAYNLEYRMQRWALTKFDAIIAISDAIVRDFDLRVPHVMIEGGVDESSHAIAPGATRNDDKFVIASAGSLKEANGFELLLEAFSRLKGDHFRLRIAGGGPLEGKVKSAAAVDPRIEFLGFLDFEQVLKLYQSADVLVNSRITKNVNTRYFFPSKLFEFLASGRPVISTPTGNVEHEYAPYVYLLTDETPEALAALLQEISQEPREVRAAKGARGREFVLTQKSWGAQGKKVVAWLRSLFSEDSSTARGAR